MHNNYSLLAPGPVNLHPRVREILSEPMIHHRTPEFDQILARVLAQLKKVFQTEENVFIHSSTGSGGMESLLVNTISAGESVLAIVSGKFGERWAQMAKIFGAQVDIINVPWGEAVDVTQIELKLRSKKYRAVLTQACETSTAVAHPLREIANCVAQFPETLLLVDAITALGAYSIPMDEWKIDGLVGGSQKAFMIPTGLSFVSFSKKAWAVIENCTTPRFYFDVRHENKANLAGETFFSSSVLLIKALDYVLKLILDQGLDKHFAEIHRRALITRKFAKLAGLELYSKSPSDSLTAICMPAGIDGQKVRLELEKKYNITVMGGQDQAKGKILRIGHMGYIQDQEMLHLFDGILNVINELSPGFFSAEKKSQILSEIKRS